MAAKTRPELDGLRGLAAYIVVVSHVSNETGLWDRLLGVGGGQIGVMLFFVLSGYLMGALYLHQPFAAENVLDYVRRRVARVVPLYYLVVTISLSFQLFGMPQSPYPVKLENALQHYLFLSGVSVFWTIPVEIQFYFGFLALWWLNGKSPLLAIGVAFGIVATLFSINLTDQYKSTLLYCAPYFILGAAVSYAVPLRQPEGSSIWSAGFLIAFALAFLFFPKVFFVVSGRVSAQSVWREPIYLCTTGACLLTTLRAPIAPFVLGNKVMRRAGAISYSVYLLHMPIIDFLQRIPGLMARPTLFLLSVLIVVTIVAEISFRVFEFPARQLLRRSSRNLLLKSPAPEH